MLSNFEMSIPTKERELCDSLRYQWERLQATAVQVTDTLLDIQGPFKESLINGFGCADIAA